MKAMEEQRENRKKEQGNGSSPEKLFFFRKISRQGDILIISIPKPLYPMLIEGGFLRRKLKITLEKLNVSEESEDDI